MEKEMTPEQALNNLRQVCENFQGNLQDHKVIQHSLKVVEDALKKEEKDAEPGAE